MFLFLASVWKVPPWDLYNAWLEDGEAAEWIDRAIDVNNLQARFKDQKKSRMIVF